MIGSYHLAGHGVAGPVVYGADANVAETITTLAPTVVDLLDSLSDPRKKVEVLRYKLSKATPGSSRYKKLEAKLRAAEEKLALVEEGEGSTREFRALAKVAIMTGIGVGAALIFFILVKALKR